MTGVDWQLPLQLDLVIKAFLANDIEREVMLTTVKSEPQTLLYDSPCLFSFFRLDTVSIQLASIRMLQGTAKNKLFRPTFSVMLDAGHGTIRTDRQNHTKPHPPFIRTAASLGTQALRLFLFALISSQVCKEALGGDVVWKSQVLFQIYW